MTAIYAERRTSRSAEWSRRTGYFSLVLLVVSGLGHRYGFVETIPFLAVMSVVAGLAVFALVCAIFGFLRLWQRGDKAGISATAGAFMALLALSPFIAAGVAFTIYPELNDISTDTVNPPAMPLAIAERDATMNPIVAATPEAVAQQIKAYPAVTGRRFEATVDQVLDKVVAEAGARGWQVHIADAPTESAQRATVEMETFTPVFAFVGDAVVRLVEEEDATYVDMRSASRFGRHDFGHNARLITSFLAAIDASLKTGEPE